MTEEASEARFPPAEFVRRGPPVEVRDLDRAQTEKWARVMVVAPEWNPALEAYEFLDSGPFTLPMAVRREDVDAGSRDAWSFYTHPYSVFPEEAAFYNRPGRGCLGARLFVRGEEGIRLYDEVGAGLPDAEHVADSFPGAMGVLRRRTLGDLRAGATAPYAGDLLEFELDVLELLRLATLLLRTQSPQEVLREVSGLLEKPSVGAFAEDWFDAEDRETIAAILAGEGSFVENVLRFRVRAEDFTKVTDVTDAQGRQAIAELLSEWEAFEAVHGAEIRELSEGIQQAEAAIEEIKEKVRTIQDQDERRGRVTKFFARTGQTLKLLKADAVKQLRTMRALEERFHEIPGYDRLQGLTGKIQEFEAGIGRIHHLARELVDHNVTTAQIKSLRTAVREQIASDDPEAARRGLRNYDLRLRAEILGRVLTTYSLSAFVLRRPDALPESPSRRNVARINRMARALIEYFRGVRYGEKTLGRTFDETWGQVLNIEGHL